MVYFAILLMLGICIIDRTERSRFKARVSEDWILDAVSLTNHFILIPIAQVAIVYQICSLAIPQLKGTIQIGWGAALFTNMLIDYGWYWNHRLLHAQTPFWGLHAVHHAPEQLNILATSRNSLWSPLFMVYFWLQPLAIYLAQDPIPFLTLAGFGLIVNFWGHTGLNLPRNSKIRQIVSLALIQPEDHFWHHSTDNAYCNFATVFNFWDKLHGTWHQPNEAPQKLGFELHQPLWKKLFFPV